MNTITLTINEQETNALLTLIDLGVKSGGLNQATNAAFFLQKIQSAQAKAAEPNDKPKSEA